VGIYEQYLIQKFLARTLLFNSCMRKDLERLKFRSINVDSEVAVNKLVEQCIKLIEPLKTT
jgi:hypothetical protein